VTLDAKTLQITLDSRVATAWLGRTRVVLDVTGSTNDDARKRAAAGAEHGTVVIALSQTAGRGRRGRTWTSLGGAHVMMSVVLRPNLPIERVPELSLVVGLGVASALETLQFRPGLKWPNDVELNDRKVGGILCELVTDASGAVECVIAGVGLNVDVPVGEIPDDVAERFTSLSMVSGRAHDLADVYAALFAGLEAAIERHASVGFSGLRADYESRTALLGGPVRASVEGRVVEGIAVGVSASGELLVREADGAIERLSTGEVERVRRTGS